MNDYSAFLKDALQKVEEAIAKRDRLQSSGLNLRIEELEADLYKAESALNRLERVQTVRGGEMKRLLRENTELRQELRALRQVVNLQEAVEGLLKRING